MIGIFDSGLGGLSALRELRLRRPDLDILYYADTAHLPYGNKSREKILAYAHDALSRMTSLGAEVILIACGTVSSVALPALQALFSIPLYGVILPTARLAYHISQNKRIGIVATRATIQSRAFETALAHCGYAHTYAIPCPLWVPLVEEGVFDLHSPLARSAVEHYLSPLKDTNIDTLILGCTHFSHLAPHITRLFPHISLVGAGEAAAAELCSTCPKVGRGESALYTTDNPTGFEKMASRLLGAPLQHSVKQINLMK